MEQVDLNDFTFDSQGLDLHKDLAVGANVYFKNNLDQYAKMRMHYLVKGFREKVKQHGILFFPEFNQIRKDEKIEGQHLYADELNLYQQPHSDDADMTDFRLLKDRGNLGTIVIPRQTYITEPIFSDFKQNFVKGEGLDDIYKRHLQTIIREKLGFIINNKPGFCILDDESFFHARCVLDHTKPVETDYWKQASLFSQRHFAKRAI